MLQYYASIHRGVEHSAGCWQCQWRVASGDPTCVILGIVSHDSSQASLTLQWLCICTNFYFVSVDEALWSSAISFACRTYGTNLSTSRRWAGYAWLPSRPVALPRGRPTSQHLQGALTWHQSALERQSGLVKGHCLQSGAVQHLSAPEQTSLPLLHGASLDIVHSLDFRAWTVPGRVRRRIASA